MIEEKTLNKERDVHYIKIEMYRAPLIIIRGKRGYVMCGYLNIETAEKLGDAGALVRGVKDLQTMMNATIEETTTAAESIGLHKGKKVEEVIDLL
ncbi:YunC family protein [Cuniculiplasma sp. SKW3]|uniref:YunC family protein n=1 Tax=unclassified Cuniculiplasma TaxID=2619706 RepID=UPI003FD52B30